ncbi:hypothetical protein DFJ73DRAFT_572586 [Zopfochytrium polystomum]|nr:hypothetical protein DFJ73DRAFT_572586 [Zopfochytrium polystomum]
MGSRLRIIVATVAFGLGINKKDVRSVIHFNMPKSLENYVQEIGRSGRDGYPAYCHAFLSAEDYIKHRSFAFSEGVDEPNVWRFVLRILGRHSNAPSPGSAAVTTRSGVQLGYVGGVLNALVPIKETEVELDMKENVLSTLLSYMDAHSARPLRVMPAVVGRYAVHFTKTAASKLAEEDKIVASILEVGEVGAKGRYSFNAMEVCSKLDMNPSTLMIHIVQLKKRREIQYEALSQAFHVELCYKHDADPDGEQLEALRKELVNRMDDLELSRVAKLDQLYETLSGPSYPGIAQIQHLHRPSKPVEQAIDEEDAIFSDAEGDEQHTGETSRSEEVAASAEKEATLKLAIQDYFETNRGQVESPPAGGLARWGFRDPDLVERARNCKNTLAIDLRHFISQNSGVLTTGEFSPHSLDEPSKDFQKQT